LSQKSSTVAPLSQKTVPVAPLSQWLQLMLAEIARKRAELDSAQVEAACRSAESRAPDSSKGLC